MSQPNVVEQVENQKNDNTSKVENPKIGDDHTATVINGDIKRIEIYKDYILTDGKKILLTEKKDALRMIFTGSVGSINTQNSTTNVGSHNTTFYGIASSITGISNITNNNRPEINITVIGDVNGSIHNSSGNISIHGDVKHSISNNAGNINVGGTVSGNISTNAGNITGDVINGSCSTTIGNITGVNQGRKRKFEKIIKIDDGDTTTEESYEHVSKKRKKKRD